MHNMNDYKDIINLTHPASKKHPRMSMENRAAQFSPFAALTGYDNAIKEASRYIVNKKELSDEQKELISNKLNYINDNLLKKENIKITYFAKDKTKNGGIYKTINGIIYKIDLYNKAIIINKQAISIYDVIEIEWE